ncbi:MAG: hypothetical protein R2883_04880 [Caldisericia bacterium]
MKKPNQCRGIEDFSKAFKDAIEKAGGSEKFSEVMDDTEEMFHIETAKLADKMKEYEKEYIICWKYSWF